MQFLYWIIGIILLAFFGYTFFLQNQSLNLPANESQTTNQQPEPTEEDEPSTQPSSPTIDLNTNNSASTNTSQPVYQAGWETFSSNAFGVTFQYPLNVTYSNGTRHSIDSIVTQGTGASSSLQFTLSNGTSFKVERGQKQASQTVENVLNTNNVSGVYVASVINPSDATEFLYVRTSNSEIIGFMQGILDTVIFN